LLAYRDLDDAIGLTDLAITNSSTAAAAGTHVTS
jgi:hypothetical protein